jgi:hypothetical protein
LEIFSLFLLPADETIELSDPEVGEKLPIHLERRVTARPLQSVVNGKQEQESWYE